jgi:type VI secretion system protein ImpH
MAGFGWHKDHALTEQLFAESYRFDFFQAVRLLEAVASPAAGVGEGVRAEQEAVNFRSSLGAAFPASEIDGIRPSSNPHQPPEMTVNFIGIAGAFGPLPRPLSERILDRARRHDTAGRDFIDIFNHRLASLFYRVRQRHRAALSRRGPEHSHFARYLFALIGLATKGVQGRLDLPDRALLHYAGLLALPDRALLHYAGLLALMPRSLHAVERIVAAYFGVRVKGTPLVGRWVALGADQETRLGASGRNSRLGAGAILGTRFWDQSAAIRLDLGPLDLATFRHFLPGGDAHRALHGLLGFVAGHKTQCEVHLLLAAAEVPPLRLSPAAGGRLGWTSWLATRPLDEDANVVLQLPAPE